MRPAKWMLVLFLLTAGVLMVFSAGRKEAAGETTKKEAPLVMKFGVNDNTTSIEYKVAAKLNEKLMELSGGQLKFDIFPDGQLGNAKEMVNQVMMGLLDAYQEPLGGLNQQIPELSILEMPYIVKDFDHLKRIVKSDWGKSILDRLEKNHNIKILDMTLFGIRQTSSNRPLRSMADYKGLRIRVPASRGLRDWAEAMGGRPTAIAFAEVYLALKTNTVDAQENPLPTIYSMKFYEAQKAIAIDNHLVQDKSILFSFKRWNSLSEKQQGWLKEAATVASAESVKLVTEQSESLIKFFKEQGLEITYPDTAPMREAMKPYYEKFEAEKNIQGLTEKLMKM